MRVTDATNPATDEHAFTLSLTRLDTSRLMDTVLERAIQMTAEHIAAVWVEQHQQELLAKLDPQAVANLAVAAAGGAIRDILGKKLPDVVQHHHHRDPPEVYQRSVFGGLRRIR